MNKQYYWIVPKETYDRYEDKRKSWSQSKTLKRNLSNLTVETDGINQPKLYYGLENSSYREIDTTIHLPVLRDVEKSLKELWYKAHGWVRFNIKINSISLELPNGTIENFVVHPDYSKPDYIKGNLYHMDKNNKPLQIPGQFYNGFIFSDISQSKSVEYVEELMEPLRKLKAEKDRIQAEKDAEIKKEKQRLLKIEEVKRLETEADIKERCQKIISRFEKESLDKVSCFINDAYDLDELLNNTNGEETISTMIKSRFKIWMWRYSRHYAPTFMLFEKSRIKENDKTFITVPKEFAGIVFGRQHENRVAMGQALNTEFIIKTI